MAFTVHFQGSWSEDRQACEVRAVKSLSAEGALQTGQKKPPPSGLGSVFLSKSRLELIVFFFSISHRNNITFFRIFVIIKVKGLGCLVG